mgnify:CR=1 FL=1
MGVILCAVKSSYNFFSAKYNVSPTLVLLSMASITYFSQGLLEKTKTIIEENTLKEKTQSISKKQN